MLPHVLCLTSRVYYFRLRPNGTSYIIRLIFLPFSAFFFIIGFSAWRPTASMAFLSHHFPGLARCMCCEGVLPQTRVLRTCASPDFSSSDGFGLTTFSGFFWSLSLRHSTSCFCVRPGLPALGRTLHAPTAALRNHSEGFGFDQDIGRWRSKYQQDSEIFELYRT